MLSLTTLPAGAPGARAPQRRADDLERGVSAPSAPAARRRGDASRGGAKPTASDAYLPSRSRSPSRSQSSSSQKCCGCSDEAGGDAEDGARAQGRAAARDPHSWEAVATSWLLPDAAFLAFRALVALAFLALLRVRAGRALHAGLVWLCGQVSATLLLAATASGLSPCVALPLRAVWVCVVATALFATALSCATALLGVAVLIAVVTDDGTGVAAGSAGSAGAAAATAADAIDRRTFVLAGLQLAELVLGCWRPGVTAIVLSAGAWAALVGGAAGGAWTAGWVGSVSRLHDGVGAFVLLGLYAIALAGVVALVGARSRVARWLERRRNAAHRQADALMTARSAVMR